MTLQPLQLASNHQSLVAQRYQLKLTPTPHQRGATSQPPIFRDGGGSAEAVNQGAIIKLKSCPGSSFQDGRDQHAERSVAEERLDGIHRSKDTNLS